MDDGLWGGLEEWKGADLSVSSEVVADAICHVCAAGIGSDQDWGESFEVINLKGATEHSRHWMSAHKCSHVCTDSCL